MFSKSNSFLTYEGSISITLRDDKQFESNSPSISKKIEELSSSFSQCLCYPVRKMTTEHTTQILRNNTHNAYGYDIKIILLLSNLDINLEKSIKQKIKSAVDRLILLLKKQGIFFEVTPIYMALKNKNNLFYNTSYTGKPAKKFYSFKENQLTFITIKYTNEGRNSLSLRPRVLKFTHNASHVTGITYEYLNRPPSPSHVVKLKEVVKKYVDDHPECDSFYKMIELPDYNQALYYACIKSKIELVQLLIDHNTYNELHLDFNQPAPNGTLLDQVEHAQSTELSLLLQSQGAMTTESLLSVIVEPEHQDKHVSTASSRLAQVDAVGHQEKNHLSENTPPRAVYFFRRPLPTHLPPLDNTHSSSSSSSPTPAVPRSPL